MANAKTRFKVESGKVLYAIDALGNGMYGEWEEMGVVTVEDFLVLVEALETHDMMEV